MNAKAINCNGSSEKNNSNISFGTDGIRGEAKKVFTDRVLKEIGFWANEILSGQGPIIIGQDSRTSSNEIAMGLAAGLTLTNNHREVWLLGLCTTPAVAQLIKKWNASGGMMISASHNPPQDNGIKIFDDNGNKISSEKQSIISNGLKNIDRDIIRSQNKGDILHRSELLKDYETSLLESIDNDILKDIPIVLDLCWGSAVSCGEKIFKSVGAKVTTINSHADGKKINVNCGSTNLKPIQTAVLNTESEIGFAFDGDADRMIAVDRKGRVIDGDHILYLWGSYLKEKNQLQDNRLITTVMANLGLEKEWEKDGGILERTQVGDANVHQAIIRTKANLGGEQSGHILSQINGFCGDGVLTALQISNICKNKKIKFTEWLDQSFKAYPQKLMNIPIGERIMERQLIESENFREAINKCNLALGNEGRIFVRRSGTEPLLRIMVESQEKSLVDLWISELSKIALKEFN